MDLEYCNKIRIFPSSNRDVNTSRYGDNFVTEYNLSSLINKLLISEINGSNSESAGFVISTSMKKVTTDGVTHPYGGVADFNIAGYFIHVDTWNAIIDSNEREKLNKAQTFVNFTESIEDSKDYIVAQIKIDNSGQEAYWRLVGEDSRSSGSGEMDKPTYRLKLLLKVGDNWIINPDAKLKFSNINIDDGRIS